MNNREAFEAWWGDSPIDIDPLANENKGHEVAIWAWQAWQAALASQAQQESQWISVEERLPELGEKVLGIYDGGMCAFMRVCAGDDNWNWAIGRNNFYDDVFYDDDDDYQVTDWTPLPQNLKKGKNE